MLGKTGCETFQSGKSVSGSGLLDKGLHKLGDFFLLASWKFRCLLKYTLQSAFGRLPFWLRWRNAEKCVDTHAEGFGQLRQDFPTRRRSTQLPKSDARMVHTDLVGQLHLCQSGGLSQLTQVLRQGRTVSFTCSHGRIITDLF
jgi:hypothetical protein